MFGDIKEWLANKGEQIQEKAGDIYDQVRGPVREMQFGVDPSTFDPSNPESVGKVQQMLNRLGYKGADDRELVEDSMFGQNTEKAWRQYVNDQRMAGGDDPYQTEKSQYVGDRGMLGRAYFNLDKKMKGFLPGGFKRNPGMESPMSDRYKDRNPF